MRGFDVAVSAIVLVLLLPLMIAIGLAVRFGSRGPVLYTASRVGQHGRLFTLYKFRTMRPDSDRSLGVTVAADPRVTPLGRVLRKYKLDELPQLVNVLKGDMSLVGPRPEYPPFVARYTVGQRRVLDVRPGITSVASLAYRQEERSLPAENAECVYLTEVLPRKLALETEYLARRTVWSDIGVLLRTAWAVVTMSGSRHADEGGARGARDSTDP